MPGRVRRHTNGLCHCCDVQFDQHPTQKFGRICYAWIDCTIYKLEEKLHKICSIVASLTGEMAAQSSAYHAHGTADSDKSCCYPWFVCHDKTLANYACSLRLPPDDKSSY